MGLFTSMKDMKNMVHEAPGLIDQSNQLAANAKAQAAAQEAMAAQQMAAMSAMTAAPTAPADMAAAPAAGPSDGVFAPINGVSIELYAEITKSFAEVGYDQTKGPELAARKGVAAADWEAAVDGWNARMTNPAVGARFNALYSGR